MNVGDSCAGLVRAEDHVFDGDIPVFRMRDRIERNKSHIPGRNQILKRLRRCLFIQRVLVNDLAHGLQVRAQHGLPCAVDRPLVPSDANRHQDEQNRDDDHQLQKREAQPGAPLPAAQAAQGE